MSNEKSSTKVKLDHLMEWFKSNPKLPEKIHPILLKRFLKCMNMDVDETKKLIEHNYHLRSKSPNIFINRDPYNEATEQSYFNYEIVPLPGLTPDNHKLFCYRLVNTDVRSVNSVEESKCFFLTCDARFAGSDVADIDAENSDSDINVDMESLASGEIHIVDIGNFTMRYIAAVSIMVMRTYMNFMQEAYPVRLKAMHIINCPQYLNRMVAILKPFIRDEVFKMFHFHKDGLESLYECVPRDMLPEDLGGKAPRLSKLSTEWWQLILKRREYLIDDNYWQVSKTPNRGRWSWW